MVVLEGTEAIEETTSRSSADFGAKGTSRLPGRAPSGWPLNEEEHPGTSLGIITFHACKGLMRQLTI